jgi:hypothetical protein
VRSDGEVAPKIVSEDGSSLLVSRGIRQNTSKGSCTMCLVLKLRLGPARLRRKYDKAGAAEQRVISVVTRGVTRERWRKRN